MKRFGMALALTLGLAISTFAGNMPTGGIVTDPPPPPTSSMTTISDPLLDDLLDKVILTIITLR